MANITGLHTDLLFLNDFLGDRRVEYRAAPWRSCAFEDDIWPNELVPAIDFRVKLDDGRLLTDVAHEELLEIFKTWICIQSHFDTTGGKLLDKCTLRRRICHTITMIDYILLNAARFSLAAHGLQNVTQNDLVGLLLNLSQSSSVANSIYLWPTRLASYLKAKISTLDEPTVGKLLGENPILIQDIPTSSERMLDLSEREIVLSRAWLWREGYYYDSPSGNFRYCPSTTKLSKIIFANTLGGMHKKVIPPELFLGAIARYYREYPAVPVKSAAEGRMSTKVFPYYVAALRRLGLLSHVSLPVPVSALSGIDELSISRLVDLKDLKRYRNLPQELVLGALRNSIEFSLKYGEDLIASFLNFAREAKRAQLDRRAFGRLTDMRSFLTPGLIKLGITNWSVHDVQTECSPPLQWEDQHPNFHLIRSNVGLWELLRVLYGAVQVCVGILMARRQAELSELIAHKCIDTSKTRMIFRNRKSGLAGMRKKEARPIPAIAVQMIDQLESLQTGLISLGELKESTSLFAFPSLNSTGLVALNAGQYNETIDYFCDYFETSVNSVGQRYYIRQHQLRRFIAMLFFWGRSFGGLDTLRWYLGHTDVEHLYHYITESTPGDVLRSIKSTYAADQLRAHANDTQLLADLLESHFGTRDFSVLDFDELSEYIEELMDEGRVKIEPEFLKGGDGSEYRVLIIVSPIPTTYEC